MGSKLYQFIPSELQKLLDESNGYADVLRKVGMNPKGGNTYTLKKIIKELNLNESKMQLNRKKIYTNKTIPLTEVIIDNNHPNYSSSRLLKKLVDEKYKAYKCEMCGIDEWMGKPLSLQLHHKDGNRSNNLLKNLCILCPNCHAQTDSYSGKNLKQYNKIKKENINKNKKIPPISRKKLKQKIRTTSFSQIGKEFGVTDNTVRKWCKKYNLPHLARKIKEFTDSQWEKI